MTPIMRMFKVRVIRVIAGYSSSIVMLSLV